MQPLMKFARSGKSSATMSRPPGRRQDKPFWRDGARQYSQLYLNAPPKVERVDSSGKTIRTEKLVHPDAKLLDQRSTRELDAAKRHPGWAWTRPPGLPRTDPRVQRLVPASYVPHAKGPWPDPDLFPAGFSSPDDRHIRVLGPGELLSRFGWEKGAFVSPIDEPFPKRGLADSSLDDGYYEYEVLKPLPVWAGFAAPAQGQPGGAMQYFLLRPVEELVEAGFLKRRIRT